MRYAVLSDVHANLEALRAVLADCRGEVDAVVCLGDIVGYGADPEAALDLLAERAGPMVAGNHDVAVAGRLALDWFNPVARAAVEWTAERLDGSQRAYLGGLPLSAIVGEATLVHASPLHPEEWEYLITPEEGFSAFAGFDTRLCFVGHSHRSACWSIGSSGPAWTAGVFDARLESGRRYLVNVGSVGQPRDRDPRACYAIWDSDARRILIRRVSYPTDETRRKILAARLPRLLADRLQRGI
jgi:diadenosine tetraphosphatase ApaH/serine/threonine PP2A family protein phosphatase